MVKKHDDPSPTLHDLYTLAALKGLLAGTLADGTGINDGDELNFARRAFSLADAMWLVRQERTEREGH
jgi:hypothetical protein